MGVTFIYEFEMHYHFQLIALTQALRNVHFPENYANFQEMYREASMGYDRFKR